MLACSNSRRPINWRIIIIVRSTARPVRFDIGLSGRLSDCD